MREIKSRLAIPNHFSVCNGYEKSKTNNLKGGTFIRKKSFSSAAFQNVQVPKNLLFFLKNNQVISERGFFHAVFTSKNLWNFKMRSTERILQQVY